ncbi:flagellar hook-length control protein FliK [Bacillus tuaregi]|uniref:flagellar hook-length control protein FliK n=1 Tax=Bacillus tuaregi TaxID=1816695 RepID=UPI0008F8A9DF|nr:flagellar hook-length control protein FliK [Bacillus tuaregi]
MDMKLSALGQANTVYLQNEKVQHSQIQGFAQVLSELLQPAYTKETEKPENQNPLGLTTNELKEIVQFLKAGDFSEMEFESELFERLLTEANVDFSTLITELLNIININVKDVQAAIQSVLQEATADEMVIAPSFLDEEFTDFREKLPSMDLHEALAVFVHLLPDLNGESLSINMDQQGLQLAKALKLFELSLQDNPSSEDYIELKNLLQRTVEKLELISSGKNSISKAEILDKVFTPLVKDVNQAINPKGAIRNEWSGINQVQVFQNEERLSKRTTTIGQIQSFTFPAKQDQLVLLQGQANQLVTKDQLIRQFEAILAKSSFHMRDGNQKLFIKLYPEHLGSLRIELTQQNAVLTAKILTTTANAKELLESQLQGLKQAFQSQNLQVEKIEIAQQFQQDRYLTRDQHQEQGQQQTNEQEEKTESGNQHSTVSFEEVLLNVEA